MEAHSSSGPTTLRAVVMHIEQTATEGKVLRVVELLGEPCPGAVHAITLNAEYLQAEWITYENGSLTEPTDITSPEDLALLDEAESEWLRSRVELLR